MIIAEYEKIKTITVPLEDKNDLFDNLLTVLSDSFCQGLGTKEVEVLFQNNKKEKKYHNILCL